MFTTIYSVVMIRENCDFNFARLRRVGAGLYMILSNAYKEMINKTMRGAKQSSILS